MQAAIFHEIGQPLTLEEVPKPKAGPAELVIKVAACGICGSDLHASMTPTLLSEGTVLGHEYAGEIVDIGPGVTGDWQIGDRVTAMGAKFCGTCPACARGSFIECDNLILQGFDPRMQGAYAEYATCFAPLTLKIPDEVSLIDAAAAEPLSVGLAAWRLGNVPTGGSVLILGAGPIGLSVAKWARFFGARDIVVSEFVPERRERVKGVGTTLVVDGSVEKNPVSVMERETGRRPSVIFECVGKPILEEILGMCTLGTHIVMAGTCMELDSFSVLTAAKKGAKVSFLLGFDPVEDFQFTLDMLAAGRMSVDPLRTATIALDELPEMFESLKQPNDHCKVVVVP